MFKNPKWITFDILGLCNQLLATQLTQRAIQQFNDLQQNTILIDRIRSLAIISSSWSKIKWVIIWRSFLVQWSYIMIVYFHFLDRRKGCVGSIVSDGPDWTEDGPKVDRGRTRLWLFWGRCKNVSCSTGKLIDWVMSYFKVNNKFHFGLKLKRNRGPNSGQPRLTVTGDC